MTTLHRRLEDGEGTAMMSTGAQDEDYSDDLVVAILISLLIMFSFLKLLTLATL